MSYRGRPNAFPSDDQDGNCAACQRKSSYIMTLEQEKKSLMQDFDQLNKLNAELRKQIEQEKKKFQNERGEKEDPLHVMSEVASSKPRDNNPITDLRDQNRPTQIGEKLSELYDKEWSYAYEELEKQMNEREVIQTLLRILLDVFSVCIELSTTSFERVQRSIELPESVIASRIRIPRRDTDAMCKYFKGCVEVSWLSVVQDPPLVLNTNPGETFDNSVFREFTSSGPYVEYVVWPAMYLHADGPLLTKGVAQGCKDVARPVIRQSTPPQSHRQHKPQDRLSAVASSKLQGNNPNITDHFDKYRPTKIGEKLSELFDNEWTEAFDELEIEKHMNEREVIQTLLRILLEVFNACRELSTTSFFERVQRSIELPESVLVTQKTGCAVVLPEKLKQQIKEFRKFRAPRIIDDIAKVISTRIRVPHHDTDAMHKYFKGCVTVSWLSAVQNPPLVLHANAGEKFDTSVFRDYTSRGPYVEFVVWPALHLHADGPLLAKGVAQGCKDVVRHMTRQPAQHKGHTQPKPQDSEVASSSKPRDHNPNITDLCDQNRPTKIGEKISELYDNEWTDAYDELEKQMNDRDVIQTLLKILVDVFNACNELSTTSFFERVQRSIELPESVTQKTSCTVVLPDQLKQQIKEFRKLRAPNILDDIANVIASRIGMPRRDTEAMCNYFKGCVEVSWLSAVQDPPLVLNTYAGEKFDTSVFKDYTSRGPYVEFVVWPALHLHGNGPLLAKGVAQGCKGAVRRVTRQLAPQQGHKQHKTQERHGSPGYQTSGDQYHGRRKDQLYGRTGYIVGGEPDRYNQYPDRPNSRPLQNDTRNMVRTQYQTRQGQGQSGNVHTTQTQYGRPATQTTL